MSNHPLDKVLADRGLTPEQVRTGKLVLLWFRDGTGRLCTFHFRGNLAYLSIWPPSAIFDPGWGAPATRPALVAHRDNVTKDPLAHDLTSAEVGQLLDELTAALARPGRDNPVFGDHPSALRDFFLRPRVPADLPELEDIDEVEPANA